MNAEEKNVISLHELQQLTQYCLNIMSLIDRLAGGAPKEGWENAEAENELQYAACISHELLKSVRKIKIATLMQERTLICVSGMQGAGKTTLMQYFYGLDGDYLNISLDRGEQIPVFITESGEINPGDAPKLYAVRVVKDEDGEYRQVENEMDPEEFRKASKGTDATTLYLELRVPYQHTYNDKKSFVLLPGFEAQKSYRETLVDFAVSSSDAAIFAFDGRLLSQQDNYKHLKELAEKFGANIIYAITRSDSSGDGNAAVRDTFVQEMKIEKEDQVVCTGAYKDPSKNEEWISQLKNAINTYGSSTMRSQESNLTYLWDEINEIRIRLTKIEDILESEDDGDLVSHENDKLLQQFDRAVKKQTQKYQEKLRLYYDKGFTQSREALKTALNKQNNVLHVFRKSILGTNPKDLDKAEKIVVESLYHQKEQGRIFIPDQYRMKALEDSLHALESPENASLQYLLAAETTPDGKKQLAKSNQNLAVPKMVYSMLQKPDTRNEPITMVSNVSTRNVMSTIVEIATYYYSVANYDALAEAYGNVDYKPDAGKILLEDVAQSAQKASDFVLGSAYALSGLKETRQQGGAERMPESEAPSAEAPTDHDTQGPGEAEDDLGQKLYNSFTESSAIQKLSIGLASMTGMDLLGDAQLNMIPQIAASFGVSVGFVAAVTVGALGAGAAVAVSRDVARIQCTDLERANMALNTVYENLQEKALQDYKDKMQLLRDRLEQNICDLDPRNRKPQQIYNAKKQINTARNLLDDLADRCMKKMGESFV